MTIIVSGTLHVDTIAVTAAAVELHHISATEAP
jgi:hypothetical protein